MHPGRRGVKQEDLPDQAVSSPKMISDTHVFGLFLGSGGPYPGRNRFYVHLARGRLDNRVSWPYHSTPPPGIHRPAVLVLAE